MQLTPEQTALLPTDEEVAEYRRTGWYISKKILSDEEIDAAVEQSERYYAGETLCELPERLKTFAAANWKLGANLGQGLRKHDYASFAVPALAVLTRHPLVGAIAARLAGTPAIRLWHDQLLYKPPQDPAVPTNVGWHTDRGYWMVTTSANMLTAWIPFHDCGEREGTITMVDGSHRWPDNTQALDFFSSDLEGLEKRFNTGGAAVVKTPMLLRKGQVSFHNCLTIHGSGPNHSSAPRRSIAVHLQDDANRYQDFRFPDGTKPGHFNLQFCRQADGIPDFTDPEACPTLWSES